MATAGAADNVLRSVLSVDLAAQKIYNDITADVITAEMNINKKRGVKL